MSPLVKRVLLGVLGLVIVVVGGASGYYLIGDGRWQFWDCMYMTVISVTTVGYGETLVDMDKVAYARAFTILLLLFGTGSIVYFASTITAFIVEGDLKNVLFSSRLKKRMKRMKDHVVVCGAGSTGRSIIEEMLKTGMPVVAIDLDEHELKEIAEKYPKAEYTYLVGDATDDDLLATINLARAVWSRRCRRTRTTSTSRSRVARPIPGCGSSRDARSCRMSRSSSVRAPTRWSRRTTLAACAWSPRWFAHRS